MGSDLGNAVKGFKKSMNDEADNKDDKEKKKESLQDKEQHDDSDTSGKP